MRAAKTTLIHNGHPDETEAAFYEAMQHGDIDKLMACWADEEEIVCVHPGGMRLVGVAAIRSAFEAIDKPTLKPLPATIFEMSFWKKAKVGIDYHVELEHHYYSVPYQYARKAVELRVTASVVEILCEGKRIAAHARVIRTGYSHGLSSQTTVPEHMPKAHQAHLEWSSERLLNWGKEIGVSTQMLVSHLLYQKSHPELGYRACLGLLSLAKRYSKERLEVACAIAVGNSAMTQKSVRNILTSKLDLAPANKASPNKKSAQQLPLHENIRGSIYYH